MNKYLLALCASFMLFSSSILGAAEADRFFDAASTLNSRGSSIGKIMSKYTSEAKKNGHEQRQADLVLLWSIAETGSMCAILNGNIIGAAGMMDKKSRNSYMEMVNDSITICKKIITEKIRFLDVLPQVKDDKVTKLFATELASQLREMDREFNAFTSK